MRRKTNRSWLLLLVQVGVALACCVLAPSVTSAADRIIDQQPYDVLRLKGAGHEFKLMPIKMQKRRPLINREANGVLRVRLMKRPKQQYEVKWSDIEQVKLFEQLVLEEAAQLVEARKFDEAYEYYQFLHRRDPEYPGLRESLRACMFHEARYWQSVGRFQNSLAVLEELYLRDRRYSGLMQAMGVAVDRLASNYFSEGKDAAARRLLASLDKKYPGHPVAKQRRQQLLRRATEAFDEAKKQLAAGHMRHAHDAIDRSLAIWPDLREAQVVQTDLYRQYPIVRVGVRRLGSGYEPGSIRGWAARRTERLTDRLLFEPTAWTGDGGHYQSPLGSWTVKGDLVTFAPKAELQWQGGAEGMASMFVAWRLLNWNETGATGRAPRWLASIQKIDVTESDMLLTWPNRPPLWQARLQVPPLAWRSGERSERLGPYRLAERTAVLARFERRAGEAAGKTRPVSEVIERPMTSTRGAIRALRARTILIYDRVAPWDLALLRNQDRLQLIPYAAPSTHLLVLNGNRPRMADPTLRRALAYALDRETIVTRTLGDGQRPAGRILSGPFPLGYACDKSVEPRAYHPRLAVALLRARQKDASNDSGRPRITLAHPPSEIARRGARAIQQQWEMEGLGFKVELLEREYRELASSASLDWDVMYVQWYAMEPLADADRLLGLDGLGHDPDPAIQTVLDQLAAAPTREDAVATLHQLHQIVHQRLPVIGLWELDEHAAVHRTLAGVGEKPVTLYQNIDQWRIVLKTGGD